MLSTNSPPEIEFDQIERITSRLRDLVRNYPKGLGLVKEFLQNADDAGASNLLLIYDRRTHQGRFEKPAMDVVLGPSLLFINDRLFSDEDFQRIQQIGEGGKVKEAARTGRFGQGFNTCYSASDHPSLMTGDKVAWFDPHHFVFDKNKNARAWSLSTVEKNWPEWLNTFMPAGWKTGMHSYPGTVFRLPLRSESDAEKSEILPEPFTDNDFSAILQELHHIGAAILIFLRSVTRLEIREIDVHGQERICFKISTKNDEVVDQYKSKLRTMVDGNPKELLIHWKNSHEALPIVQYEQIFELIDIDGNQSEEVWAVTTGLFKGPEGILLDKALDVWDHHEKAIPWAGAAVQKNYSKLTQKTGGIACFLPLPEPTKWPVWLHGWFDLSSNRRGITRSADVGDTTKARFSWNQALMEHAVGKAWALLIQYVNGNPDENLRPYDNWLRPSEKPDDVELSLIIGFYQSISQLEVIRALEANSHNWYRLDKIRADLPSEWFKRLIEPLIAEGWIVSDPSLPLFIKDGFKKVKKQPQTLSSKILRSELRIPEIEADIACSIEDSPRLMLRKREWIESLAEFCSDGDRNNLQNLPLAILSDGLLHTFTTCGALFLASQSERLLLQLLPNRLLDTEYKNTLKLDTPAEAINLVMFDLKGLVESADDILKQGRPQPEWLCDFFEYLTNTPNDLVISLKDKLMGLEILADQFGNWHKMGFVSTPLISGDISKSLRLSLSKLGIPFLDGNKELTDAVTLFASKHNDFLWKLTPNDLADFFKSHIDDPVLNESALDDPEVYNSIMHFLTSEDWLEQNDSRLPLLRDFRLLTTICGQRVAANEPDIYIPGGFKPPKGVDGKYRLINAGPLERWMGLFEALGVPRLNGITFVEKVLLPAFSTATIDQCKSYLIWLRDELRLVVRDLSEEQRKKIHETIRRTPILLIEGGGLYAPRMVYRPKSEEPEDLLGEFARVPDREFFSHDKDLWNDFFEEYELPRRPLAADIYNRIKSLSEKSKTIGVTPVRAQLRKLLDHLRDRWTSLADKKIEGPSTLSKALSEIAWFTSIPVGGANYAACNNWPERLWRANELVPVRFANLIASKYPILEGNELPKEMSDALGLITQLDFGEVLQHFNKVLALPILGDKSIDSVHKAAEEFYRYIGRLDSDKILQTSDVFAEIKEQLCIFIGGYWRHPSQCFIDQLPFYSDWAFSLAQSDVNIFENTIIKGLSYLGVRQRPDNDDWVLMLTDFSDKFQGKPLPHAELNQVHHAIRLLRSATTEWLLEQDIYVPLIDGRLENARNTFLQDDSRYNKYTGIHPLPLIENIDDVIDVGRRAGAKSLRKALIERLKEQPLQTRNAAYLGLAANLKSNINSKEFYHCLQRIAYEKAINSRDSDLDPQEAAFSEKLKLPQKIQLVICSSIKVETYVDNDDEEIVVFDLESSRFFEEEIPRLWLREAKHSKIKNDIVKAICELCDLSDQINLSLVLNVKPDQMAKVLDDEEVATLPKGKTLELETNLEPVIVEESTEETYEDDYDHVDFEMNFGDDESDDEVSEENTSITSEITDEYVDDHHRHPATSKTKVEIDSSTKSLLKDLEHPNSSEPLEPPIKPGQGSSKPWKDTSSTGLSVNEHEINNPEKSFDRPQNNNLFTPHIHNKPLPHNRTQSHAPENSLKTPADGPPTKPGHGSSKQWDSSTKGNSDPTRQVRMRTYVHEKIHDDYDTGDSDSRAKELGDTGEKVVMEYEKKRKRAAKRMPINHEGYDIESKGREGMRFIEVKSIDGPWGDRGVGVSRAQYEAAMRLGKDWWLYVVEYVTDPKRSRVHPIVNPFHLASEFRFDSGWIGAQVDDFGVSLIQSKPLIGASYERESGEVIKIEGTTQNGEFWRVRFVGSDGTSQRAIWNASWRKV